MAKRELSSTLKNLKFMQRGASKEDKTIKDEEEVVLPDGKFSSFITITKKCMVIMEGDPSPGAIRGRMSFQSFNPSIDKLNERQSEGDATCSGDEGGKPSNRKNDEPVSLKKEDLNNNNANGVLKRKHVEVVEVVEEVQFPNKSANIIEGNHGSSSNDSRTKSHKRGKLDFNVLRSPKSQNKSG